MVITLINDILGYLGSIINNNYLLAPIVSLVAGIIASLSPCNLSSIPLVIGYITKNSKHNSLEKLLFAIGIRYVWKKTAKILAKRYKNIDNLFNASLEELTNVNDVGEIIAKSIKSYLDNIENQKLIDELKELGLNFEYLSANTDDKLEGMTFVLTGTLEKYKREELTKILENKGAKVTSSVTKKTTGVIVGDKPGSKYDKALKLGVKIYKEEDIENIIN